MEINNSLLSVNSLAEQASSEATTEKAKPLPLLPAQAQDDDHPPPVFRRKLPKIRIGPKRYGSAY